MTIIKAVLLKPLDSDPIGAEREFSEGDFARLEAKGAVKRAVAPANKAAPKPRNKAAAKPKNKSA